MTEQGNTLTLETTKGPVVIEMRRDLAPGHVDHIKLKAEFNAEPHVRGTVSMARAQSPDSANSQFFICFGDAKFLDRQYTAWGKVVSGMENVDKIKRGEPVREPDKIVKARLS